MKRYFTADIHFADDRLHLFGRDLIAKDSEEMDNLIIKNWNNTVKEEDIVYVLGDVSFTKEDIVKVKELNGKKILIRGNYDQQFTQDQLLIYFDEVYDSLNIFIGDEEVYLNHYPMETINMEMSLVGHVHSLWRVQRNMINVSLDAWHFIPVSEDKIKFTINAIRKFYDENVFVGEYIKKK